MLQNAVALYGVQIANIFLPLVTVPYLARVLRPEGWGFVVFAQTVSLWLTLIMEYGFMYSATRDVARHSGEPEKLRQIAADVTGAKLLLSLFSAAAAVVLWLAVPLFHENATYLVGALWLAIAQGLNPMWYFQGIERMRLPALCDVLGRVAYTICTFLWIRTPADAPRVLLYQALSITGSLAVLLWLMFRVTGIPSTSFRQVSATLRNAWHFFLFQAVTNLYMKANTFILGLVLSPALAAFFSGPEKLIRSGLSLTGPINQILYPRLSSLVKHDFAAARRLVIGGSLLFAAFGTTAALATFAAAPWIVRAVFGPGYEEAVPVLRLLALICPFSAVSSVLGIRWMFPLGLERLFNRIVVAGAILDVGLAFALASWLQVAGFAWAVLATEIFITASLFVVLWKRRLNPFQDDLSSVPVPS